MSGGVFISYRRASAAAEAGRLSDALDQRLGGDRVFRDMADIHPGDRFDPALREALAQSHWVLVLIDPDWLAELQRRQAAPAQDYVRLELATALSAGKPLLPVLLRGAALPAPDQLPPDLRGLLQFQAMALRDETWAADLARLVARLEVRLGARRAWAWRLLRAVMVALAVLVLVRLVSAGWAFSTVQAVTWGTLAAYAAGESAWALWAWRRRRQG